MGKVNTSVANDFIDSLGTVFDACTYIKDAGACDKCPISHNCLEETPLTELENFCTRTAIKEFLDFADDVEYVMDYSDYVADMADEQRKETDYWYD